MGAAAKGAPPIREGGNAGLWLVHPSKLPGTAAGCLSPYIHPLWRPPRAHPPRRCCPTLPRHPTTMSTKAAKPAPAHPAYVTMIAAAIKALKDRTGSSAPAIAKYLGATTSCPRALRRRSPRS